MLLPSTVAATAGTPGPPAPVAAPTSGTGDDPAPEEATEGTVRVVLDDVEPAVAHVGEPVTLRGRIINDSPQRRRLSSVTVRAAWAPLTSRADVTHWLEGRDQRETGWVLGQDAVGPVVVPGAQVPFSVVVDEDGLAALPGDLAALAIEIEAADEVVPGSAGQDPATPPGVDQVAPREPVVLRTVLTAARTHAVATPLDVTWVVPLTLPPDPSLTSHDDRSRHEAWLAATGPGSQARTWLDSLALPGVTWMVDPTMLVPPDPADDLAPDDEPGEGEPGDDPDEEQPDDDLGTATTAPGASADDAQSTQTAGTVAATGAPGGDGDEDDGDGDGDGDEATTSPQEGPEDRLEEGEELGDRPASDGSEPATAEAVEDALVALRGLLSRAPAEQLWWTPTADPDVAALLALQDSPEVVRDAMDLPLPEAPAPTERLLRSGRSDIAWPALAAPPVEEVAALDRLWASRPATPEGIAAVVVPRESLSGGSNTSIGTAGARVQGHEEVVALGADTRGAALLAGAGADSADVGEGAVTQRLLADSLTAYQQDPSVDRSMLYAPPRGSRVPDGVLDGLTEGFEAAPWARQVSATDLLAEAAGNPPVALSGVAPAGEVLGGRLVDRVQPEPSPLVAPLAGGLVRLVDAITGLEQVLTDTSAVQTWEPVVSHLWSTRWRGEPEAWAQARQEARRPVVRAREGIHVNPSTVNFLSDQGIMQMTVVNDLPVAVEGVRVEVRPDRNLLRIVEQPEPISIGAASRATVSFTARAVTRGTTTVSARLTTPNGTVLGDDAQVSVRVQPTGVWIYWVLGSIAGLVLVLGLVRARRTEPRSATVAASTAGSQGGRRTTGTGATTTEENR